MEYYSKRNQDFMKKHSRVQKIESFLKGVLLMLIPVGLVVLIILDWLRVFRISWMFN